jgi:hypothetical protein
MQIDLNHCFNSVVPVGSLCEGVPVEAQQVYQLKLQAARAQLKALDSKGATLATLRTVAFLLLGVVTLLVVFEKLPKWALFGSALSFAVYVALAVVHARVISEEEKTKVRQNLAERGLLRLQEKWHDFVSLGTIPEGHLYAADLDVLGHGSLFQRIDETGTKAGERQLIDWLLNPSLNAASVLDRQIGIKELAHKFDFRQALITETKMAQHEKAEPKKFIEWAEGESKLGSIKWAFPLAHVLPLITLTLGILALFDVMSGLPALIGLLIQIAIVFGTRVQLNELWNNLRLGDQTMLRFEDTFRAIDAEPFESTLLKSLRSGLAGDTTVSTRLSQFTRILGFAELKNSGQMHGPINALLLWDILVLFRLDSWRKNHGKTVRKWFDALAKLEALSCFATYAFERPNDVFPKVIDGDFHLEATELGHPLIQNPVRNDLHLQRFGSALIITGSNMSGKTTYMRATGLNTVMALCGLPVCAKSMTLSVQYVMTSMRLKDSLERGVSYFYAEVQRMKSLLDMAQQNKNKCLFLLDELFMGTNTAERQVASLRLVELLLERGASGCVTTHDLSICELSKTNNSVKNVHFRDHVADGNMTFDYTLRDGIVTTTNALNVLRMNGIPI